jgi:hypothetical protein
MKSKKGSFSFGFYFEKRRKIGGCKVGRIVSVESRDFPSFFLEE